jgi:hypothetical protein
MVGASMVTLAKLFGKWGTDKAFGYYPGVYECLFRQRRGEIRAILEIGIGTMLPGVHSSMVDYAGPGYRPGGSLRAWRDYFEQAIVCGLDVQPDTQFDGEARIVTRLCNSTDASDVRQLMRGDFPNQFDIIIDDGSHYADDQLKTMFNMFPFVAEGGVYIVEDLVGDDFRRRLDIVRSITGDSPHFFLGPANNLFATIKSSESRYANNARRLFTSWNTSVYIDDRTGRLRHGQGSAHPADVRLALELARATLLHAGAEPERPIHCVGEVCALGQVGGGTEFEYIWSAGWSEVWFGLRHKDLYLCAEPDGRITLSKTELKKWERFTLRNWEAGP